MKHVYIAGPYRAKTREAVAQNVAAARHVGRIVASQGHFPVMPTVNTAYFDHDFPDLQSDEFWLEGTKELMRRCDAVVLVDGWCSSSGARAEVNEALDLGIPVYVSGDAMRTGIQIRREDLAA